MWRGKKWGTAHDRSLLLTVDRSSGFPRNYLSVHPKRVSLWKGSSGAVLCFTLPRTEDEWPKEWFKWKLLISTQNTPFISLPFITLLVFHLPYKSSNIQLPSSFTPPLSCSPLSPTSPPPFLLLLISPFDLHLSLPPTPIPLSHCSLFNSFYYILYIFVVPILVLVLAHLHPVTSSQVSTQPLPLTLYQLCLPISLIPAPLSLYQLSRSLRQDQAHSTLQYEIKGCLVCSGKTLIKTRQDLRERSNATCPLFGSAWSGRSASSPY